MRPLATRHLDALEFQLDLHRWWKSDSGKAFSAEYDEVKPITGNLKAQSFLARLQAVLLENAETYWISEEMADFVERVEVEHHPLYAETLTAETGFLFFEKSVLIPNYADLQDPEGVLPFVIGPDLPVRAMVWGRKSNIKGADNEEQPGIVIFLYTDIEDESVSDLLIPKNKLSMRAGDNWRIPRLLFSYETVWTFGTLWETTEDLDTQGQLKNGLVQVHPSVNWLREFLSSLWAVMGTPIAVTGRGHFPRPLGRRAASEFGYVPEIRVITLRRAKVDGEPRPEGYEPTQREYSHRWVVAGHWHNYNTKNGLIKKWLDPYIKGPKDKPLVLKDKIYRVSRTGAKNAIGA
jgi:hypothetical protein